jgi:two-component system, OmpR family, sensor histidine kinase MtrB
MRMVLILTFVVLLATVGATGASYVSTRNTVLGAAQDQFMEKLRDDVDAAALTLRMPPDQAALELLVNRIGTFTSATYGALSSDRSRPASYIPAQLREAMRDSEQMLFQRISRNAPILVVGVPVLITDENFQRHSSGVVVYGWRAMDNEERQIEAIAGNGWRTAAIAIPLAVVVAWLAAGAVLRPVRQVRDAARSLARGDLSTRLPVRGSDELAELVRTFNETAASLEASIGEMRRMEADARRFVADVSHELRTPLAAMTAVNEVLDEDGAQLPGDAGTAARLVSDETRKLALLVEDLIEISRFDSGAARLDRQSIDLGELIAATLRSRQWTEQVQVDAPPEIVAVVDPRRFDVIVANLVGNALRHGEPPVVVRLWAEAGGIAVEVTDRGPGLPEEVLPWVFGRFYKADAARTRSEGSGLGLSIALKNANLHGGTIEVDNRPDGGARFILWLPQHAFGEAEETS